MDYKPDKSLFIVDGSLDRPLLYSQGIPLLKRLNRHGERSYILSFEQSSDVLSSSLAKDLENCGIVWSPVVGSDHRGSMILGGFVHAWQLCRQEKINIVHCRSYRPAMIGTLLKIVLGIGYLFDMRGFLIDELVADGKWKQGSLKFKIAKYAEKWCILSADFLITTSPQFGDAVLDLPYIRKQKKITKIGVIPNCVDTCRFFPDPDARKTIRSKYGWENSIVFVFSGDAFRYYDAIDHIVRFTQSAFKINANVHLLIIAYGELAKIRKRVIDLGIDENNCTIMTAAPDQMPNFLSAADVGLSFFKLKSFANAIASPIKFAEYLSCGLPVVINPGVGDTDRIINQYNVGVIADPESPQSFLQGAQNILRIVQEGSTLTNRCCRVAQEELSLDFAVQKYSRAYEIVAASRANRR
jgi:glycosyltransferase involved in cell wall biosynthesis